MQPKLTLTLHYVIGIRYSGGEDIPDSKKTLSSNGFRYMLDLLSQQNPDGGSEQTYLYRCLKDFTEASHIVTTETNINCRSGLSPFYHELGSNSQSALSFMQITSPEDRHYIAELAVGNLFPMRSDQNALSQLQNISPILHSVHAHLLTDTEERLFNKVVKAIYNIYMSCFKSGVQWWESEQENVTVLSHEQYIVSGRPKVRDLPHYIGSTDTKLCKKVPYNTANFTGTFFLACCHGYFITSLLMQVGLALFCCFLWYD